MEVQERICRLCLKINADSFNEIKGDIKDVLNKLLPKINLDAMQKRVMCNDCAKMLLKYSDFKEACRCLHDYTIPFVTSTENGKVDLKDVYLSKNENDIHFPEDQDVCGFCMSLVKNHSAISLDIEKKGVILETMIDKCVPELDLSIIKKLVICPPCYETLQNCFHFITNCLIVEEKIKKYCETLDIDSEGQLELSRVLQFTTGDVGICNKVEDNLVNVIKVENQSYERSENANERELGNGDIFNQIFCYDSNNVKEEFVHKIENFVDVDSVNINDEGQFTPKHMLVCKEECDNLGIEEAFCEENEMENLVAMGDEKFLFNEGIEVNTDNSHFVRCEDGVVVQKSEAILKLMPNLETEQLKQTVPEVIIYKCDFCSFQAKRKHNLKDHLLKHKDPSEVTMYNCDTCPFQTKRKHNLKKHLLRHKDPSEVTMYNCDTCSFQTKRKHHLRDHLLTHKDPLEVTMFKCDVCSYQAKRKCHLEKHELIHKDPSEITMHKCDYCSFQTKHKYYIKNHLLTHKDTSEVAMEQDLNGQLLQRKDLPEVTIYKCDSCSFQARRKTDLKRHLLVHSNPSEVIQYKCESCPFQTKYRDTAKLHQKVHKSPSELTMLKCNFCSYQSKWNTCFKRHLLVHKNPSEVTTYKCDSCPYQTRYKDDLNKHLIVHKNPSEITMYKCDSCPFQAKKKNQLDTHLLKHKDLSEVTTYKCDSCSFQTKYKNCLKQHLLRHKDPSEVTMYKCDFCPVQTIHKSNLRQHMLKHKGAIKK